MMEKINKKTFWLIFSISLSIQFGINYFAWYKGDKHGYNRAKEEQKTQVNLDKKKLENHEKELKNIDSESTNDANNRLRENLRSN